MGEGSFQTEVLTLIQLITENRLRHARGPVQFHIKPVTYIELGIRKSSVKMSRFVVTRGLRTIKVAIFVVYQ